MARKAVGVKSASTSKRAPNLKPKSYPARLVGVVFLGVQEQRAYQGQTKPPADSIRLTYELSNAFMPGEDGQPDTTKPRWVSETLPFHDFSQDRAKSTARIKTLDPDDAHDKCFKEMLGLPCSVLVVNRESNGVVYDNIGDILPPIDPELYDQPELVNPTFYYDPADADCTLEDFRKQPEWIREIILGALDHHESYLYQLLREERGGVDVEAAAAAPDSGDEEELY